MRRRRLVMLLVLIATLASIALVWWRSRTRADLLAVRSPAGHLQVLASHRGAAVVFLSDIPFDVEEGGAFDAVSVGATEVDYLVDDMVFSPASVKRSAGGIRLAKGTFPFGPSTTTYRALRVPYWAPLALLVSVALALCRAPLRSRRWARQGRCRNCGYDVRETSGRCPECGTPVHSSESAAVDAPSPSPPGPRRLRRLALGALVVAAIVLLLGVTGRSLLNTASAQMLADRDVLCVYDTTDLIGPPHFDRAPERRTFHSEADDPNPPRGIYCWPRTYPYVQDDRDDRLDPLADAASALTVTVQNKLDVEGFAWGDRVCVRGPGPVQAQFAQLLQTLRSGTAVAGLTTLVVGCDDSLQSDRSEKATIEKLGENVPELDLDGVTLEQAIMRLQEVARANFIVDWKALEDVGVMRETRLKLKFWDMPLESALHILLEAAQADREQVAIRAGAGVIFVSSVNELLHQGAELRIYDVRPLIVRYHASNLELYNAMHPTSAPTTRADAAGVTREELVDEIRAVVIESVDVDSWRDNGGSIGSIREWSSRLIITQSPANHRKIEALLKGLYEASEPAGVALTRPTTFPAVRRLPRPSDR